MLDLYKLKSKMTPSIFSYKILRKFNNKIIMRKLLISLPLVLALSSCQTFPGFKSASNTSSENDPSRIIIANYEGGQVTLKDVNNEISKLALQNVKLKGISFDQLSPDQKETIIKEVVLKDISYKEARRRGLNKDQDYQEALKIFESELLKQKLFIKITKDVAEEKNLKKNYDELVAKLKDKKDIQISYIALKTEKEAEFLYKTLEKYPNSFAKQAQRKSLDKETGKKGGDLGFVMEDSLPAELVKQARSIGKDQISKPIASGNRWFIIKLIDERPAKINSFEESKDALAQSLSRKAIEDFISQSLEKAKISILLK